MQTFFAILPPAQQAIWHELAPVSRLGFVLYGGTALALRLGHRSSVDFDFFTDRPLHRQVLLNTCPLLHQGLVLQDTPVTFTVSVPHTVTGDVVKLLFFGDISFGRVGTPEWTSDQAVLVASLLDLIGTKLKVILQRVAAKDYQDIAALLRAGIPLENDWLLLASYMGSVFNQAKV